MSQSQEPSRIFVGTRSESSEPAKKPLPRCEPLGNCAVNFVKVYAPQQGVVLKAHHENGDGCRLFLDLEDSGRDEGIELHIGVGGNFRAEQIRNSDVKSHLDVYIPRSEIGKFLDAIVSANLRRPQP